MLFLDILYFQVTRKCHIFTVLNSGFWNDLNKVFYQLKFFICIISDKPIFKVATKINNLM